VLYKSIITIKPCSLKRKKQQTKDDKEVSCKPRLLHDCIIGHVLVGLLIDWINLIFSLKK